jgi:hypothetical protein
MQTFTLARAAIAAAFSFTLAPAAAQAPVATPSVITLVANAVAADYAAADSDDRHFHDVEFPHVAPGQEQSDYEAWLARSPDNRSAARAFRMHLASHGVDDVVPVWQLVRTSSSWRGCGAQPFEVAPRDKWDNIVRTLQFVERNVVPQVGRVQAVSGYRNPGLNRCSAGASASAHRDFFALDLTPVDAGVSRGAMIRGVCAAHAREGQAFNAGLGFYNGMRFHVDTNGFRRWGANGRGATSPCGGSHA